MRLKSLLLAHCQQYITQRLDTITLAQEEVRDAINQETKSSAGDKHETGRAMMQLEQEKLALQLAEVQQVQMTLEQINLAASPSIIGAGSLVLTDEGNYFLAISAGKVALEGKLYFIVSLASPIGLVLAGRSAGETVSFRDQRIRILEVL